MGSFEEKLIYLVQQHDFLFNTKSRSFKNISKRDTAWTKISKELGRPVDECRQRWRSLRDRYVRELKKKEQPSSSTGTVHREEWEYFSMLKFLNNSQSQRVKIRDFAHHDSSISCGDIEETVSNTPNYAFSGKFEEVTMWTEDESSYTPSKKRNRVVENVPKMAVQHFAAPETHSPNELFMKAMTEKLDGLPADIQVRLQGVIFNSINEECIKYLND